MANNLVLIGPECSGKTSLALALAGRYRLAWNPEYARTYAERKGGVLTVEDVMHIAKGQKHAQETYATVAERQGMGLYDTDLLSTLFYARWYYQQDPQWLKLWLEDQPPMRYFLTYPDPEWEPDAARSRDLDRLAMFSFFQKGLEARGADYVLIQGSMEERLRTMAPHMKRR